MKDFLVVFPQNIVIRRRHQEEGAGGGSFHREEGWMISLSIQPSCHLALGYEDGNRWLQCNDYPLFRCFNKLGAARVPLSWQVEWAWLIANDTC